MPVAGEPPPSMASAIRRPSSRAPGWLPARRRAAMGRTMYQAEHEGQPNTIVVGTGQNRIVKAQVTITPRAGQTELRISPGGISWDWVLNTFGVAQKVKKVLESSPTLSAR